MNNFTIVKFRDGSYGIRRDSDRVRSEYVFFNMKDRVTWRKEWWYSPAEYTSMRLDDVKKVLEFLNNPDYGEKVKL